MATLWDQYHTWHSNIHLPFSIILWIQFKSILFQEIILKSNSCNFILSTFGMDFTFYCYQQDFLSWYTYLLIAGQKSRVILQDHTYVQQFCKIWGQLKQNHTIVCIWFLQMHFYMCIWFKENFVQLNEANSGSNMIKGRQRSCYK